MQTSGGDTVFGACDVPLHEMEQIVQRLSQSELQHAILTLLQRAAPETRQLFRSHFAEKLMSSGWDSDVETDPEEDGMETTFDGINWPQGGFGHNLNQLVEYPFTESRCHLPLPPHSEVSLNRRFARTITFMQSNMQFPFSILSRDNRQVFVQSVAVRGQQIVGFSSGGQLSPTIRFQCIDKTSQAFLELSIYECIEGITRLAQFHSSAGASFQTIHRLKRRQRNIAVLQAAAGALEMDDE